MVKFSEMREIASFREWETIASFLAAQLMRGRLALILGSGVSSSFGLPSWTKLVERIEGYRKIAPPPAATLSGRADAVLAACGHEEVEFAALVRRALYEGYDASFGSLGEAPLLRALGALMMASSRGSVSRVASLNFDDLLERYLEMHGYTVVSVGQMPAWEERADVTVLHPHGVLPVDTRRLPTPIVFAQIHYDRAKRLMELFGPAIRQIMQSHTCLFIGLSGDDQNLNTLLAEAKDAHVSQGWNHRFWGVRFDLGEKNREHWEMRGVAHWALPTFADLPPKLLEICQRAAIATTAAHSGAFTASKGPAVPPAAPPASHDGAT